MPPAEPDRIPRWTHEPLDEGLHGARVLTVSVIDALARGGWDELARATGIPRRRWSSHHPIGADAHLVALVDGRPAFDAAAWERFASLVPGAVALRSRTAAALGVSTDAIRPPGRSPSRLLDLRRARRWRRRMRREERAFAAGLARLHAATLRDVEAAVAPGDDGTPFAELPAYALAARLDDLVRTGAAWELAPRIDLSSVAATAHLLRLLADRGLAPGAALLRAAELTAGGGLAQAHHVEALARVAEATGPDRPAQLAAWLDGIHGWHATRDLPLEASPLRDDPGAVARWMAALGTAPPEHPPLDMDPLAPDEDDRPLSEAIRRARTLTAQREQVARERALLHAGLRALAWTIAARLAHDGPLERADDAFDLALVDLLRTARGVPAPRTSPRTASPTSEDARRAPAPAAAAAAGGEPSTRIELRGAPASRGVASGPVLVLEEPTIDAPVDGRILVCRVTDPGWMPLLLRCAGLVTERGGPLSHAAIVARELGVPAVVGVAGARAAAVGVQHATIDGSAGVVVLHPTP